MNHTLLEAIDRLLTFVSPLREARTTSPAYLARQLRKLPQAGTAATEPEDLAEKILDFLVSAFRPDIVAIYRPLTHCQLQIVKTYPTEFWQRSRIRKVFNRRETTGFAIGDAITRDETLLVQNTRKNIESGGIEPFSQQTGSELIIPILVDSRVAMVIVLGRNFGRPYSIRDKANADCTRSVLAGLLSSCSEQQSHKATISFLTDVGQIPMNNIDNVLSTSVSRLNGILPTRYSSVWLYNKPTGENIGWPEESLALRFPYTKNLQARNLGPDALDQKVISVSDSLSGICIRTRKPEIFHEIGSSDKYANPIFAAEHNLRWMVSVPILGPENECFGVLNVYPRIDPKLFDPRTATILQALSRQLATYLRIAVVQRAEIFLAEYDGLFVDLLSSHAAKENWDQVARRISAQLACEACSVFLVDKNGRLTLAGTTGLENDPPYDHVSYDAGEGLTGKSYSENRSLVYYREFQSGLRDQHISKFREKLHSPGRSKSILFVPVSLPGSAAIGLIRCNNKDEALERTCGRFTREDVLLLRRVGANLADVAIKVDWSRLREDRLEQLVHNLHHELLSPVNGIYVLSEYLLERIDNASKSRSNKIEVSEQLQRYVESIFEGSIQVNMVVRAIGGMDEKIVLDRNPVNIVDPIYTCLRWLHGGLRHKNIELEVLQMNNQIVQADREHLQRLMYNLFWNAVKYSDRDESVRYLEIRPVESDHNTFALEIEDNGIGIPDGEEQLIFQQNIRGSNASSVAPQGSGLGLTFCEKIAHAHGWKLLLMSRAKPTVFRISFGARL